MHHLDPAMPRRASAQRVGAPFPVWRGCCCPSAPCPALSHCLTSVTDFSFFSSVLSSRSLTTNPSLAPVLETSCARKALELAPQWRLQLSTRLSKRPLRSTRSQKAAFLNMELQEYVSNIFFLFQKINTYADCDCLVSHESVSIPSIVFPVNNSRQLPRDSFQR